MKYLDRDRAEGFGKFAKQYDETRPSYSEGLIEWLSVNGTGNALDIGCGTGQVAVPLMNAGWNVIGIEPDMRMAQIARSKQIVVIVSTFEKWVPNASNFDLITAGTSWHWINPEVGYDKVSLILKSGGRLAIFRNFYNYSDGVSNVIKNALAQYAPELLNECVPLGIGDHNRTDSHKKQVENRNDLFSKIEIKIFKHERAIPVDLWIKELMTHSPIYQLEKEISHRLLTSLKNNVTSLIGNKIGILHDTYCLAAWKH